MSLSHLFRESLFLLKLVLLLKKKKKKKKKVYLAKHNITKQNNITIHTAGCQKRRLPI